MKVAFGLVFLLVTFSMQAQSDKKENKVLTLQSPNTPAPLWIVDDVKMSEVPTANRFLDIDPKDIVSFSVVKGDSALIHYGEAGRNGVIVVTTKKAKHKKSEDRR